MFRRRRCDVANDAPGRPDLWCYRLHEVPAGAILRENWEAGRKPGAAPATVAERKRAGRPLGYCIIPETGIGFRANYAAD